MNEGSTELARNTGIQFCRIVTPFLLPDLPEGDLRRGVKRQRSHESVHGQHFCRFAAASSAGICFCKVLGRCGNLAFLACGLDAWNPAFCGIL